MDFILTIAFIILFFMHLSLRDQVNRLTNLQKDKTTSEKRALTPTVTEAKSVVPIDVPAKEPSVIATPLATPVAPPQLAKPNPVIEWFKENTLIKVGAIIFFLGIVWFVSYAIAQGWISPTLRIWLGIAVGIAIATLGHSRRRTNVDHYLTLTTLGVSTIIAAIYAGQQFFSLLHPAVALMLLTVTIGYAVFVSIRTDRSWLCYVAAVAGLLAPSMINAPTAAAIGFFSYLTFMSAGFLSVLWFKSWRLLITILTIGSAYYEISYASHYLTSHTVLWFAVVAQSTLLYGALALSSLRITRPQGHDVTTLGILGICYTSFAYTLTENEALLTFFAAFIVAAIGYTLYHRRVATAVVGLHSGLALFLVMVASSFAFNGFTLTLALALEVGLVIALAAYIQVPRTWFLSSCVLFIVPLLSGAKALNSTAWQDGILHTAGYSLYTLVAVSAGLTGWLLVHARRFEREDFRTAGGGFMSTTYVIGVVTSLYVAEGLVNWFTNHAYRIAANADIVISYLLFFAISLAVLHTIIRYRLPEAWLYPAGATLWLPTIAAVRTIDGAWPTSWFHLKSVGLLLFIITSFTITHSFINQHLRTPRDVTKLLAGSTMFIGWLLFCAGSWKLWHSILTQSELSLVLSYMSWLALSYALLQFTLFRRLNQRWITAIALSFIPPLFASLSSLSETAWHNNWLHPHAAGLYVLTTIVGLVGIGLRQRAATYTDAAAKAITQLGTTFLIVAGLYACRLVWLITHSVLAADDYAVTVALFVYTVAGLCFYLVGKQHDRADFKLTSAVLLSGVVARLALIDVWNMEMLWRIFTFLGIGILFILTALVEKPFQRQQTNAAGDQRE